VSAPQTHADLWTTSAEHEPEQVYTERWELVRLIREAGEHRSISQEEVATWRPRPNHTITLRELCDESLGASAP
jgi:hypothetical protein